MDKYGVGDDPYCYPGTQVLKNLLNIRNDIELSSVEEQLTILAVKDIEYIGPPYHLRTLQKIHQAIFKDLYEWAGMIREIDVSKGNTRFCNVFRVVPEAGTLFSNFKKSASYQNLSRSDLVSQLAEFYIEVNMNHPFRDGNGRAQRFLFEQMVINCGYEFRLAGISKDEWVSANVAGVACNYSPMTDIFDHCIGEQFI